MARITATLTTGMAVQLSNTRHEWQADKVSIEKITSNVHIEGNFDDAQRKRLAQIAKRCPVHKTLAHGVEFEDNAMFGPGGEK